MACCCGKPTESENVLDAIRVRMPSVETINDLMTCVVYGMSKEQARKLPGEARADELGRIIGTHVKEAGSDEFKQLYEDLDGDKIVQDLIKLSCHVAKRGKKNAHRYI